MSTTPTRAAAAQGAATDSADTVRRFLAALEDEDFDTALDLLTEDGVWINVSLPTIRGRAAIARALRLMLDRAHMGFRAHCLVVATQGDDVVLTERTDEITMGRVAQRFWVYGRFEVRDGRIAVWRDSFDWRDFGASLLRGLAGAVRPELNRRWPG